MNNWKIKIFYDGACPLCSKEMRFLMSKNPGTIQFEDTSVAGFDPGKHGLDADVNRLIHGSLPNGQIVKGMEVFRRAYDEIGLGWLLKPTGWPLLKPIFDLAYIIFAKNRRRISRLYARCTTGSCRT